MCAPWLAVLPLGAYHFGVIHPYGAVLTIIASPVLSLILPILWGSVFLGLEFPQLASLVGDVMVPALIALQWILDIAVGADEHQFLSTRCGTHHGTDDHGVLCLIAGRIRWSISALAFGLLCSPDLGFDRGEKDAFRWDVLSVGNGSAHLLQMGSEAWLIDAGSSGELHVSRRCILPALRNQNIRRLEGVVCTHADLDHIAGVVPILRAIPVGILRIPPLMLQEAQDDVTSPCHTLLATAKEMNIPVIVTTRGDGWACGSATFNTLWPPKDLRTQNRNHASLAFEILVHGRRLRFSGDADSKLMI